MTLRFKFSSVEVIEFGVGLGKGEDREIARVPVSPDVSDILHQMVNTTWSDITQYANKNDESPRQYELSEKYSGTEYVYLNSEDPLAVSLSYVHTAVNLPIVQLLDVISDISFYFARLVDSDGASLTAIKRNIHFTGLIRKDVLKFTSDTLELSDQDLFKLDQDFDLIIDSDCVHIWRPNAFRILADLSSVILASARRHLSSIQAVLPFIDLSPMADYVSTRSRAAQYVAVINGRGRARNIDRSALEELCSQNGIGLSHREDGRLCVDDADNLPFLEVLDRRRYSISLVQGDPELYRASSRVQL